jgi:hypothetical protein
LVRAAQGPLQRLLPLPPAELAAGSSLPGPPSFREKNRRHLGKSQSTGTDSKAADEAGAARPLAIRRQPPMANMGGCAVAPN